MTQDAVVVVGGAGEGAGEGDTGDDSVFCWRRGLRKRVSEFELRLFGDGAGVPYVERGGRRELVLNSIGVFSLIIHLVFFFFLLAVLFGLGEVWYGLTYLGVIWRPVSTNPEFLGNYRLLHDYGETVLYARLEESGIDIGLLGLLCVTFAIPIVMQVFTSSFEMRVLETGLASVVSCIVISLEVGTFDANTLFLQGLIVLGANLLWFLTAILDDRKRFLSRDIVSVGGVSEIPLQDMFVDPYYTHVKQKQRRIDTSFMYVEPRWTAFVSGFVLYTVWFCVSLASYVVLFRYHTAPDYVGPLLIADVITAIPCPIAHGLLLYRVLSVDGTKVVFTVAGVSRRVSIAMLLIFNVVL